MFKRSGLRLVRGKANVIGAVDYVLAMLSSGDLDPTLMITHGLGLDEAPDAYALADTCVALKERLVSSSGWV